VGVAAQVVDVLDPVAARGRGDVEDGEQCCDVYRGYEFEPEFAKVR